MRLLGKYVSVLLKMENFGVEGLFMVGGAGGCLHVVLGALESGGAGLGEIEELRIAEREEEESSRMQEMEKECLFGTVLI